jgi:hypothetical protein
MHRCIRNLRISQTPPIPRGAYFVDPSPESIMLVRLESKGTASVKASNSKFHVKLTSSTFACANPPLCTARECALNQHRSHRVLYGRLFARCEKNRSQLQRYRKVTKCNWLGNKLGNNFER